MANPIQEYQTARSMPIPALVAVLNGQSDMVSLGVAHAALKEKMEAEVAKKGAGAMQMAQSPKVVQKDMAMAQGLAGTPADLNVPMGGIVGSEGQMTQTAAGGGSVVAFQAGGGASLPSATQPTFGGMMSSQAARNSAQANSFMGRLGRFLRGPLGIPLDLATNSPDLNVGEQEYLDLIKKLQAMGYSADMIAAMSPQQRAAAAQGQLPSGQADTGGTPTQSLAQLEAAQAKPKEEAAPAGAPAGIAAIAASQARVKEPASFEEVTNQAKELAKKYEVAPKDKKEFKDFSQEYVDTLKAAGYDFDLVKDNITKLAEEKEALKGEKKEATSLRLIEAGLGILGGESPYAFVNIGKGATPALQGLAKDLKEIKKTSRALDKETLQLQLMQNQMAEGKVKYAQGRLDKQEERADRLAEKKMDIEVRIADRIASNDIQRFVAETSRKTQIEVQGMQQSTALTNLEATRLERAAKRDLDMREAAMKQAAEDFKMEQEGPEKQRKILARAAVYFDAFKAENFGAASTGMVAAPPAGVTVR